MLRLDQLGPTGKVIARIELPFSREAEPGRTLASADSVIVSSQGNPCGGLPEGPMARASVIP